VISTTLPLDLQGGDVSEARTATIEALERSTLYSEELDIELQEGGDREYFKWFLASVLFGARISETIARNTYQAFRRYRLLTPRKILSAGWDFLVHSIMGEGGYVRYDGRKSTQVLRDCDQLIDKYGGSLIRLHDAAEDASDLEDRLQEFYGIGPVTTNIFLRELRPYWKKADPKPLPAVYALARRLKIDLDRYDRKTLRFVRLEAGLIRQRKGLRPSKPLRQGPSRANVEETHE
jgi:endonuclease III